MIRTTYQGRAIKVLAARGKPHHRKMVINGYTLNHAWQGDDAQALDWFRRIIDRLDASGGPGNSAELLHGAYTSPHWWEPGTFDVNPKGHATPPGGFCLCSLCVIGDIGGGKARYAPLAPDACRDCHQEQGGHRHDIDPLNPHPYTEPTPQQRAGRQAFMDACRPEDDEDEIGCDAIYPEQPPGYLGRPRCLHYADHRDAENPDRHQDHRGFTWPREAAAQ
ncbi:hypothetical protein [Streptomyces sp. NPDC005953]|uniref:hypothetical protein n=1 Tax=Streptomyces sp. NPDC005953 TaxID=3156719 RepID=UPI0033CC737F